jgi:hypothetical protein
MGECNVRERLLVGLGIVGAAMVFSAIFVGRTGSKSIPCPVCGRVDDLASVDPIGTHLSKAVLLGEGVALDYAEAAKWFRKEADQGNNDARYYLGYLYYIGRGVLQDYLLAHMWFNLAASGFSESVSLDREKLDQAIGKRDLVASKMTPAQITEAKRMAREWIRKMER